MCKKRLSKPPLSSVNHWPQALIQQMRQVWKTTGHIHPVSSRVPQGCPIAPPTLAAWMTSGLRAVHRIKSHHTQSYIYIYIYIHIYIYIYLFIYLYIYLFTYIYIYLYLFIYLHIYIYIYRYRYIDIDICTEDSSWGGGNDIMAEPCRGRPNGADGVPRSA